MEAEQFTRVRPGRDHILVGSVLLLTGMGLVILYSCSGAFAQRFFGDSHYFIVRQLALAAIGMFLFFAASLINLDWLRKGMMALVLFSLALCILTFFPGIGLEKNGAKRWIHIGSFGYQPSELVKVALPLYLAHIFDKKQDSLENFRSGILPPALITTLFFVLIYWGNNFSTAVFIAINALVIFFVAGVSFRYFIAATVLLLPTSILLILTKPHRLARVRSFFHPEWDPQGAGFQVKASVLTLGSGGFWGKGIGQGTRKIASIPEVHSDFIFSAFSEEAGFLGVLCFFIIFAVFVWRAYRNAIRADTRFKFLLAFGLATMVASQALVNIAVVSGSLPATGIPLPFFSAGGSSLATTLFAAGLIVNVSRTEGGVHVR
ncbi:MAG: putative lipid II flippase FtsW [Treponema sp.]|jgi:cell division protein FtsW|nr:putative lipid II flippase FtsW [Treponema sp.]